LTAFGDVTPSVKAMRGGSINFLIKPVEEEVLIAAVTRALQRSAIAQDARRVKEEVLQRIARLTPREREVGALVADGLANKEIASKLGTAEQTVKVHRARMMHKLAVNSAAELARLDERTQALGRERGKTDAQSGSKGHKVEEVSNTAVLSMRCAGSVNSAMVPRCGPRRI